MGKNSAIKINEGFRTLSRRLRLGICGALAVGGLALSGPSIADQPSVDGILAESLIWLSPPIPASQTPFQTGSGKEVSLEVFRGRVVLLNFWATWCAPCIREMPSLDRLQAKLRDEGLDVVAVSQDFAGLQVVEPFFERLALANLELYLDSGGPPRRRPMAEKPRSVSSLRRYMATCRARATSFLPRGPLKTGLSTLK